ncbi:hypothetical protein BTA51_08880 [Hahella sp. CCB-MM4]|uniref:DUF6231 family protein n=1 Tax=Hahella sp. (strain CCB-MM4) TaxID=1926491 RepID=UPI000B9AA3E3|nr:DUF6231 family protein [Hahella sp. CCB-MM4]OZG73890.1 hypothetical protein BTA51_08880 [Hahella sp. CCB-MM4]
MPDITPNNLLEDWLNAHRPSQILTIGASEPPSIQTYQQQSGCRLNHLSHHRDLGLDKKVPDTVIISDYLEKLSVEDGKALLTSLRNFLVPHVLVFIDHQLTEEWDFNTLIGIGFRKVMAFDHQARSLCCYSYDIDTYNPRRTWNNADHWANPELYGKYWW